MNIKMFIFFFNLILNLILFFLCVFLFVFCDFCCCRLGVVGVGIFLIVLLEGDDEVGRDGEDLVFFLWGGIINCSECGLEISFVFELLLLNSSFW